MKNLRKLVPKEELDALFREVYQTDFKEESQKETIKKTEKRYHIFAYKVQRIIKRSFISLIPVSFSVENFSVTSLKEEGNLISVGYDIEGKFRFFILVEDKLEEIIRKLLEKNGVPEEKNIQSLIDKFLDITASQILEEINLKKNRILSSYVSFYEEEILTFCFECLVYKERIKIYISLEEILLDIIDPTPIVFSPLTSVGKKNLRLLKKYIPVKIVFETSPIYISSDQLKEGLEIPIKDIHIKKRKVF